MTDTPHVTIADKLKADKTRHRAVWLAAVESSAWRRHQHNPADPWLRVTTGHGQDVRTLTQNGWTIATAPPSRGRGSYELVKRADPALLPLTDTTREAI